MFQQPLYDSSGNTLLSKHRTKSLAKIMKFEIAQAKLFTYLVPSILLKTVPEYFFLFRVESRDIFLKLRHDWNRHRSRSHTLSGLCDPRGDRAVFKVNIRHSP